MTISETATIINQSNLTVVTSNKNNNIYSFEHVVRFNPFSEFVIVKINGYNDAVITCKDVEKYINANIEIKNVSKIK